jgi:multidrug efflux system membrane fusion protein
MTPRLRSLARLIAIVFALMTVLSMVAACKGDKGGKGAGSGSGSGRRGGRGEGGPAFPVEVYPVESKLIEYNVTAPGTIAAVERVQLTARVAGGVDKVSFTEGQKVKKGDLLVVIDSQRYQAAVAAANASVAKAQAAQADAEAMVKRREKATEKTPGLIPGEEIEGLRTKVLTAKADVALAVANLQAAQLNLRDSSVRATMDGVIQTRTVDTGQYVQPGYVMATLLFSDSLLLRFQVSPLEAPRLRAGMVASFKLRETTRVFTAKITLIAASADPDSRMVPVTAEIEPTDYQYFLRPGSFTDVTVPVGGQREKVVIPREAVRPTERGFVAYVVQEGVARERVLTLGLNTSDGWVEVREGLTAGEKLVLRGTEPLSDGSKVKVTEVPTPTSSSFLPSSAAAPSATSPPSAEPSSSASAKPVVSASARPE